MGSPFSALSSTHLVDDQGEELWLFSAHGNRKDWENKKRFVGTRFVDIYQKATPPARSTPGWRKFT